MKTLEKKLEEGNQLSDTTYKKNSRKIANIKNGNFI